MFYLRAWQRRLTHIVAPINPALAPVVAEYGYESVGPTQTTASGLVIEPMVLEVARLQSVQRVVGFIERHQLSHFLHSFDRAFFEAGERDHPAGRPRRRGLCGGHGPRPRPPR